MLLVLDGVTDPHNLGACLRSADAAGALAVIVPKDKSATLTPVVRKVACGAAEVIPLVAVTNLARTLEKLQQRGLWVVGTAGEAEVSIYDQDLTGPTILIMGAEGKGMRRLTREHCDYLVNLPMAGSVSSLNVSVATGVCLFEAQRQRGAKAKLPQEISLFRTCRSCQVKRGCDLLICFEKNKGKRSQPRQLLQMSVGDCSNNHHCLAPLSPFSTMRPCCDGRHACPAQQVHKCHSLLSDRF